MKFTDYSLIGGGTANPCEMISRYLLHEQSGGGLKDFIAQFDFDSADEIAKAIRLFIQCVALDPYMRAKHVGELNPLAAVIFSRYNKIMTDAGKIDKYPQALAGEIWHGGYNRARLAERTAGLFDTHTPDSDAFNAAAERIRNVYNLTPIDIDKLHFFVEQVKAGATFPNSLRRMLYIWGVAKMTGKTTSATMLVSLLNGDTNENNIARYSTSLANEMQIKSFAVPKISECNVCLMDECFYADMGKTYADFKRFLTSSNGRARLPFGQEFMWTGQPNYVATSNDPLRKFIKDWGDRRYLSVEFTGKPTENLTFPEIKALWSAFVLNSTRTKSWEEWAAELAPASNEKGDRQEIADELELELRKSAMLQRVLNMSTPSTAPACPQNHVSLKTFVDLFAETMGNAEAKARRGEIETAVVNVYGPRYSSTGYWLLSRLQEKANDLQNDINRTYYESESVESVQNVDLPF